MTYKSKYLCNYLLTLILVLGFSIKVYAHTKPGEILITNPGELVSSQFIDNNGTQLWRTIAYETESFSGIMLAEGGDEGLPVVSVPIDKSGKYRIFLGLFTGYYHVPEISVRFTRDNDFELLSLRHTCKDIVYKNAQNIYEVLWKEADLSGQELFIEPSNNRSLPIALAFIRLVPIEVFSELSPVINQSLVIIEDGWESAFANFEHSYPEDLLKHFEVVTDKDRVQMLIWGNGVGDVCNYPTNVGNYITNPDRRLKATIANRFAEKNYQIWQKNGWNSMRVMRDYAHKRDWEFHVYIRMQGFGVLWPRGTQIQSDFFNNHPQFHCLDREGRPLSRISYAYPEVQEHMLALIMEISSYNPDGICLNFTRGLPLVLYESAMADKFRERYSLDPRLLPEDDSRWLDLMAEVTTAFINKVKKSLPDSQRLSVIVPGMPGDCRKYGLDIARLVKDGIIDDLLPAGIYYDEHDVHIDAPDSLQFAYFTNLPGRDKIRLIPVLYPWGMFRNNFAEWMKIFDDCTSMGADALAVWDALISDRYTKVKLVGEIENYKKIHRYEFKRIPLKTLQGFRVDRYHYFEGI